MSQVFVGFQTLAESKVSDFYPTVVQEYVAGLEIPMHDVARRQYPECFEHLRQVGQHLLLRHGPCLLDFLLEGAFVAVLIEEVEVVGRLEYFDELDDVGRVYPGKDVDFVEGALFQLGIFLELVDVDDLDSHFLLRLGVHALEDFAVLALADLLVKSVVFDDLHHI